MEGSSRTHFFNTLLGEYVLPSPCPTLAARGIVARMASEPRLIVTIDGPAGGGKSTTARLVARALGYLYIDSGAMYRALAVAVRRAGADRGDDDAVAEAMREVDLQLLQPKGDDPLAGMHVLLDGEDITAELRTADVDRVASRVASLHAVRERMVAIQRAMGASGGVVMEGRDIGTVVFPRADVKIYLTAEIRVRAERRQAERDRAGGNGGADAGAGVDAVMSELRRRDAVDRSRTESPLRIPDGAIIVDTSECTIPEQVEAVLAAVRAAQRARTQSPA
jgi:cytidylate kinase